MTSKELECPLLHLTPPHGWLNDPNGLWYDTKEELWHCYFQHNPYSTVWKQPICWGHSVSKNGVTWDYKGLAIMPPDNDGGVFSGSVVIDRLVDCSMKLLTLDNESLLFGLKMRMVHNVK